MSKNIISTNAKEESVLYSPISKLAPLVFPFLKFEMINKKGEDKGTVQDKGKII